jgi:hypothetical protein
MLRKLIYLVMAAMVLTAPLLACTIPGLAMSEEEKECCRHMADQCGNFQMQMQMNDSHTCCTKTPAVAAGTLQPVVKFSPSVPDFAALHSPVPMQPGLTVFPVATAQRLDCSKSPPGQISVLRI